MNSVIRFSYLCIALLCCTCNKTGPPPGPRPSLPVQTDRNFYTVDLNNANSPEGQILLALNSKSKGVIFSLDRQGALMWEKSIGVTVENLQKWVVNGKTLFTYFHSEGTIPLDDIPGTKLGYEYICDSALNIIDSVKLKTSGLIDVRVQDKLDVHEFILLGEKHYIYETYYSLAPDNIPDSLHPAPGVKVAACVIQEVVDGKVVFQWNGADFPELYASSREDNNFGDSSHTHDYMHLNSICVDQLDNNLIVSFRNMDQIVKISRETGKILWRLGGTQSDFAQNTDQLFFRQHYVRQMDNHSLIFLDNGLQGVREFSRVVELQLNENSKLINSFRSFTIPDKWIQFAGSVQKAGENYFIGGGSGNFTLEVNYITGQKLLRLTQLYPSYRSLKY